MRKTIWGALIAATFAVPALAVTGEGTSGNYAAAMAAFEINDSARRADNGLGYQITFGIPLANQHSAVELSFYDVGRDRALDGDKDYQTSLTVNYVQDFGGFGWSNGVSFKPFVLAGIAGVQEDVLGAKHTHYGIDAGFGTLVGLPWYGLAVRTEARALAHNNESESAPANQDFLVDYRVLLGLQMPLMLPAAAAEAAPAEPTPVEACELSVVDPASGRKDCASDSDHDGVADGVDQCPATEPGSVVNAVGCPAVAEAAQVEPLTTPAPSNIDYVTFADDKADIDDESKAKLDALAALLAAEPKTRAVIEGRTDNRGKEAYNIVLGSQRAEGVRQYLISKGVDAGRLSTLSMGEFKPVASNGTDDGRKQNRSVRFLIVRD